MSEVTKNSECIECGEKLNQAVFCCRCMPDGITSLAAQNRELRSRCKFISAKLSAYENGIKIEDADKEKAYQFWAGSKWLTVSWENDHALGYEMFAWCVYDDDYDCYGIVEPEIVFPLPPSNKGEEE